uniref:Tetratricopeptide SHNi-TPR domain-containing protein n=1 Tax=Spongospora subterranea TaxID=70186 RepID=A0A0H5R5U9_9EUKA|eukprot:CRZ09157.1 hypothetical protein [Spongospora subterranea]
MGANTFCLSTNNSEVKADSPAKLGKMEGEPVPVTATPCPEDLSASAQELIQQNDLEKAIDLFAKALQAKIEICGDELASELAPFYFDYGDAILQQCSQKADVFADPLKSATEAADSSTIIDTIDEGPLQEDGENMPSSDEEEVKGDADAADEDISEEPTDLEVAWELLETARVIFKRQNPSRPVLLGLADCYSRLGDLALENDVDALPDYIQCRDMLLSIENDESVSTEDRLVRGRSLGAVFFKMAISNTITGDTSAALSQFKAAQASLLECVELLVGPIPAKETNNGKAEASVTESRIPFDSINEVVSSVSDDKTKNQLEDLADFLRQIQEKIEDLLVCDQLAPKQVASMVGEVMADAAAAAASTGTTAGFPAASSSGSAAVTNLGTIVGQKRKIEVGADRLEDAQGVVKVLKTSSDDA